MEHLGRTLESAPTSALPCVLFTDLSFPDGEGFELIRWARAQPRLAKMRIFALPVNPADHRRAEEPKIDAYLEKLFGGARPAETVVEHLCRLLQPMQHDDPLIRLWVRAEAQRSTLPM